MRIGAFDKASSKELELLWCSSAFRGDLFTTVGLIVLYIVFVLGQVRLLRGRRGH